MSATNQVQKVLKNIFIYLFFIALISCDGGLDPTISTTESGKSILNGLLTFKGGADSWPPEDSVFAVRVVAFKTYPPGDILQEIISGNAYFVLESLPLFVDTASFSIEIPDPPVELKYIAVAQQWADSITAQKAIGVYTLTGDKEIPSSLSVEAGKSYHIDIEVDFNDLPPQPF